MAKRLAAMLDKGIPAAADGISEPYDVGHDRVAQGPVSRLPWPRSSPGAARHSASSPPPSTEALVEARPDGSRRLPKGVGTSAAAVPTGVRIGGLETVA